MNALLQKMNQLWVENRKCASSHHLLDTQDTLVLFSQNFILDKLLD